MRMDGEGIYKSESVQCSRLPELRDTPSMGQGLFAKYDIKRGELILAERPLLVYPRDMMAPEGALVDHFTDEENKQVIMFEFNRMIETTISRFPPESQADFKNLHNAHTSDGSGPLLGIARTNNYGISNLYDGSDRDARYGAVCKIASRINHRYTISILSALCRTWLTNPVNQLYT